MPTDPPSSAGGPTGSDPVDPADRPLLDQLSAFGLTLEHHTDGPIRTIVGERPADPDEPMWLEPASLRKVRADGSPATDRADGGRPVGFWLSVAAAVAVLVAGVAYVASSSIGPTDPVGEDLPPPTERSATPDPTIATDRDRPDATAPAAVAILAADGTPLATITGIEFVTRESGQAPRPSVTYEGALELEAIGFVNATVDGLLGPDPESGWKELLDLDLREVVTTLDPTIQREALAVAAGAPLFETESETEAEASVALVTLEVGTGAVRAMVGDHGDFSVVTQGLFPPASTMKPVVLAEAFEQGYRPEDLIRGDGPCSFDAPGDSPEASERYTVRGDDGGIITLARATATSNNCAFVRLGQIVGTDRVAARAAALGVRGLQPAAGEAASLPLGVEHVHPLGLAAAYNTFASDGLITDPIYLQSIVVGPDGDSAVADPPRRTARAVSAETARMVTDVLVQSVADGTGFRAALGGGHEVAGKTGSTESADVGWFIGYTGHYTTAVWVAEWDRGGVAIMVPDRGRLTGGGLPTILWADFNDRIHRDLPPRPLGSTETTEPDREPILLVAENEQT